MTRAINTYQWRNREAFVRRGMRMLRANWTNRLEEVDLACWFGREFTRYCAVNSGANVKNNRYTIERRFWLDCEKRLFTNHYGYNLEDFS